MRTLSTANLDHNALRRTTSLTGSTDDQVLQAVHSGAPKLWSSITDAFRDYRDRNQNHSRETFLANVYRICCGGRSLTAT
jgi:hypothetical protein